MRLFALLVVATALGCAAVSSEYTKPGATLAEMNKDRHDCRVEVEQRVHNQGGDFTMGMMVDGRRMMRECLEAKGWVKD